MIKHLKPYTIYEIFKLEIKDWRITAICHRILYILGFINIVYIIKIIIEIIK